MKNRNTIYFLSLVALFMGFISSANGQMATSDQSRTVIAKTAITLRVSKEAVTKGQVYTGNLAKAVNHQHYAISLHKSGNYTRAIYHSRRARHLASLAIRANRYEVTREQVGPDAVVLSGTAPSDTQLDEEMESNLSEKETDDATVTLSDIDPGNE
jgi:hypothetical protein